MHNIVSVAIHIAIVVFAIAGIDFVSVPLRRMWWGVMIVAAVRFAAELFGAVVAGVKHPPGFDFICFWLYGRVALTAHQLYEPAAYHAVGDALHVTVPGFGREILDVGFPYPPSSIALFLPLGLTMNISAALVGWYVGSLIALIASIVLLLRGLPYRSGARAAAALIVLALALPATQLTIGFAQSNFFALLFVALLYTERKSWREGLWIALAVMVKPFLLALVLWPLMKRQFRSLAACTVALASLMATAIAIVGTSEVVRFFTDGPTRRIPGWNYTEITNQSVWGALLRVRHVQITHFDVHDHLDLLAVSMLLFACGAWLCSRVTVDRRRDAYSCVIALGLLAYPATQVFYAVVLLPGFATLIARFDQSPFERRAVALSIAIIYGFMASGEGGLTVVGYALAAALFTGTMVARRPIVESRTSFA